MPISENILPVLFLERLKQIVGESSFAELFPLFDYPYPLCVRVNLLKVPNPGDVMEKIAAQGVCSQALPFTDSAFLLENVAKRELSDHPLVQSGELFQQAPSSLLPVLVLAPRPGERILDACAAPGSKTTQMAALMQGCGEILAVEAVKHRYYKLKSVCSLLGAANVRPRLGDVSRLRFSPTELYDAVLVDAPCSSEGRFKSFDPDTSAYWSPRKIAQMSYKQKGILLNASRALRSGGRLLYSTCTFSPEENEEVVDRSESVV
jgi:16S rRNA (cytosine1407-C5)-methyltransferase